VPPYRNDEVERLVDIIIVRTNSVTHLSRHIIDFTLGIYSFSSLVLINFSYLHTFNIGTLF
jgi:hypothetical protein